VKIRLGVVGTIAAVVAVLFAGVGLFFVYSAVQYARRVNRAREHSPVDVAIDLSKPGEFTTPFEQTFANSHSEEIGVVLPPEALNEHPPETLLAGLNGRFEVVDANGVAVKAGDLAQSEARRVDDGFVPLAYFHPFKPGSYELRVEVVDGAPGLVGIEQRLRGRYMLCGIEMLPALVGLILGIVALVIGGTTGLATYLVVRRRSRSGATAGTPSAAPDA
jgi:hypothetical protein